ncbi:hypothetical protein AWB68_05577 [Caballeronia choica]|uniref:Uncharacterized protein n=1 Tax=Caballeronia choica TaxID=326476 RepID=A0A158KFE2_9BURK|nr:hypothetical protein [Caballeronia choica]SAL79151.1 hypothetical protein AWB68_05577 [Caballeronia choica]
MLAETKTPRFSDGAKMRDGMPLRWPFDPFVRVFFARDEFIAFMRDEALIDGGQVANDPLQPDAADTSLLLGPAFAKRKGNQAPGPWTPEQLAELITAHQLLQAQGVRNPTTTLARELGVSATTIAKHLVEARAKANEAKPGGANVRRVKGGGRQT